jgi:membrane-associated phospholipid phosphatase
VLIGALIIVQALVSVTTSIIQRPRPVGVEILGTWQGFSMPSRPMAILAAVLVNGLYALVPAGRPREVGKIVIAAVLAVTAVSRLY